MSKLLFLGACFLFLFTGNVNARVYTDAEAEVAWNILKNKPVTEQSFREACDLIQDVGQSNISLSYTFLAAYVPVIKKTGNRQWLHVLLMGWAKAKESLTAFDEAEKLYGEAKNNAITDPYNLDEVMSAMALMYLEWGRPDSLENYLSLGEALCKKHEDRENLSFIYTFRAMSHMEDTASMRRYSDSAIVAAKGLVNKNALFTALYNRAIFYDQYNLQQQVSELEGLLGLSKDSSLSQKPRLYQRTAFYFRGPAQSIYYQLMLVNLLLTDYENAWKFAELFYSATIKPNPTSPQAPFVYSAMAMVKAYQGRFDEAKTFLHNSLEHFGVSENKITYPTYQLAAGMIAEHETGPVAALQFYERAYKNGSMSYGLHLMPPEIYYAHALILNNNPDSAQKLFTQLAPVLKTRLYSAIGFYYYKYYAALLKAKGDQHGYSNALEMFYRIKDSLADINNYRAIQEVETKMRVHDKEVQIDVLDKANAAKAAEIHQERIYLVAFSCLAAAIIVLLVSYGRNQYVRKRQAQQLTAQNEILQENKLLEMQRRHRIDVMQGAIDAEENERHKIADQLHDETGSMLALAALNISSVLENGQADERSADKIKKAHELLNTVSSSLRDISHRLTPLIIEKYGFRKSLEDSMEAINLSKKIRFETVIIGFENDKKYPVSFLNNLYRIIQELTHNILKHAQASEALLELVEHENHIAVMVEDNGRGIGDYAQSTGRGLRSIQSKIAYLNGKIEIINKNDGGTLVVMEFIV